jgi:SAM-dependent methyltransferase
MLSSRIRCLLASLVLLACSGGTPAPSRPTPQAPAQQSSQQSSQLSAAATPQQSVPEPSGTDAHHHQQHPHGDGEAARHHARGFHMDFSEVERFAKHFDDPKRDAWQKPEHVIALMRLQPGQVVADVGAGTGYFLGYLSKAVAPKGQVLGLDVEPAMVEYMTQRAREQRWPNVEARTVPYDDPQLPEGKIDRVLIVNTWHHIDARGPYAQKLARSLTSTGAVFVVDFTLESDIGPPANHRLPPQRVVAELQAGGLAAHILEEDLPKQYVVKAMRR